MLYVGSAALFACQLNSCRGPTSLLFLFPSVFMMTTSDNEVLQQVLSCLQTLREEQLKLSMQVRHFDNCLMSFSTHVFI
jgi:hypothetical protein